MSDSNWTYRTLAVQCSAINTVTLALRNNPLRRGLLVACRGTALVSVFSRNTSSLDDQFACVSMPGMRSFPYREMGTLITGEIFVSVNGTNPAIQVTEICLLPRKA